MLALPLLLTLNVLAADPAPAPAPAAPVAPATTVTKTSEPGESAAASPLDLSADLRDEYLAGEPLRVAVTLKNGSAAAVSGPDLTARPWLVRFMFVSTSGQRQARFTTPPTNDPGTTVNIVPRGQRRTLLEVPSGRVMKAGEYTVTVQVTLGDLSLSTDPKKIRISPAHPVGADLSQIGLTEGKTDRLALWVHQATSGADLYLLSLYGDNPDKVREDQFLTHLAAPVAPRLSAGRTGGTTRHAVWSNGAHGLTLLTIENGAAGAAPVFIDTPWPVAELLGQPATDGAGRPHALLWVPAPKGAGGEVRLLSVDERGQPHFRRVTRLDAKPAAPATAVDSGGGVHMLLQRPGLLDIYTVRPTDDLALPVPGKRAWAAQGQQSMLGASFAYIKEEAGKPGGLSLLLTWSEAGAVAGRWQSLAGSTLRDLSPVKLPEGAQPVSILAPGSAGLAVIYRTAEGATRLRQAQTEGTLTALDGLATLTRNSAGAPVRLQLTTGALVTATPIDMKPLVVP